MTPGVLHGKQVIFSHDVSIVDYKQGIFESQNIHPRLFYR